MNPEDRRIKNRLKEMKGWGHVGNSIQKTFEFRDFAESIKFVNKVASLAEREQHHPDISIHYSRVAISLSTHSEGGITEKDFGLAGKIDDLYRRLVN